MCHCKSLKTKKIVFYLECKKIFLQFDHLSLLINNEFAAFYYFGYLLCWCYCCLTVWNALEKPNTLENLDKGKYTDSLVCKKWGTVENHHNDFIKQYLAPYKNSWKFHIGRNRGLAGIRHVSNKQIIFDPVE